MWLPFGAGDWDRGVPLLEPHLAMKGRGAVLAAGGSGCSKCLGQTMALCAGERAGPGGWHSGSPAGMCQPVWECKHVAPRMACSLMGAPTLQHSVCSPEWPREQKAKGGRLGIPGSASPARQPPGLWKSEGEGKVGSFSMPLTCWVTLDKPLPPSSLVSPFGRWSLMAL